LGLYNDYADIEHKVKKETVKRELFASIVIPFNKGHGASNLQHLMVSAYWFFHFNILIKEI
jgi:hypothetical protein